MRFITALIFLSTFFCLSPAFANNLAITNVSLADQDTTGNTYDIEFDTAWDNSWRIAAAPAAAANWDAAWVFAKFRKWSSGAWGNWTHCTLLNSGSVTPAGSTITLDSTGGVYKGAFIYRDATGTGSNSFANAQLRWDYGTDGVADADKVEVRVFGIEMVHIPAGAFYIGDVDGDQAGNFKWQDATAGAPQITSSLGNAVNTVDNDYDDTQLEGSGIRIDGDGGLDTDASGAVDNASFPTGYNAYYVMKYEITQGQYVQFLNTLTATQQGNRWATGNFNSFRYFIKKATNGLFGVDADDDAGTDNSSALYSLMNESADGADVACNWLSWMDVAAYADWAALRPMTELEFEKAARGQQTAVDDEYAWGNTTIETATTSLSNGGAANETPNQGNLNYSSSTPDGPYRVGSFADGSSTRTNSGAGYYGALELSGSLWERTVTVGNSTGRAFAGTAGDGSLSAAGHATNSDWPGYSAGQVTGASGSGFRGGAWYGGTSGAVVSDRFYAAYADAGRGSDDGGRLARTSP